MAIVVDSTYQFSTTDSRRVVGVNLTGDADLMVSWDDWTDSQKTKMRIGSISGGEFIFGDKIDAVTPYSPYYLLDAIHNYTELFSSTSPSSVMMVIKDILDPWKTKGAILTVSGISGVGFSPKTLFESADTNANTITKIDSERAFIGISKIDPQQHDFYVASVSGESINLGSGVSITGSTGGASVHAVLVSSGTVVVSYVRESANLLYARVISVSGTSLTLGSEELVATSVIWDSQGIAKTADLQVAIVFRDGSNGNKGTAVIGTVSGTSISLGSNAIFNDGTTEQAKVVSYSGGVGGFAAFYADMSDGGYLKSARATISGTTISFGPETLIAQTTTDDLWVGTLDDQRVIVAFQDTGDGRYGTVLLIDLLAADSLSVSGDLFIKVVEPINEFCDLSIKGPYEISGSINCFLKVPEPINASCDFVIFTPSNVLQPDKLKYYHPCDSFLDGSGIAWVENVTQWSGSAHFTDGKVVDAFQHVNGISGSNPNISDNSAGVYGNFGDPTTPDITSNNIRITLACWLSFAALNESDWAWIGFTGSGGQHALQLAGEGKLELWGDESHRYHYGAMVIPDTGWHFHVLDVAWDANDGINGAWTIRHSLDGAGWTNRGKLYGTFVNKMTYNGCGGSDAKTVIMTGSGLVPPGSEPTDTKVDEVALWLDAELFNAQELENLYALGVDGFRLDQYERVFSPTHTSCDLFIVSGPQQRSNSCDLFIVGPKPITVSSDLFLRSLEVVSTSGDLFLYGPEFTFGSIQLFTYAPPPDFYVVTNLYISGPEPINISNNLFIHGYNKIQTSGDLYIDGCINMETSVNLFTNGPVINYESVDFFLGVSGVATLLAKPIDWLLKNDDHNPQIIGTFTGATTVNIQIWDVIGGQNIAVSVASSGCYQIGNTGRWGWSTANLQDNQGYSRQYFYLMTADSSDTFDGQFILDIPEGAKLIHPSNSGTYLKVM